MHHNDHQFKKHFGQNFITNLDLVIKTLDILELSPTDTVLEVGPGDGRFTDGIVNTATEVNLVEIDTDLIGFLEDKYADFPNLKIHHQDILQFDLESFGDKPYKVFGALPYNISKQIIQKFIETKNPPTLAVFVIQKEVAQNYTAKAPKATFLSNYAQIYADIEYQLTIPKQYFVPEPQVDGGVIRIIPKSIELKNPRDFQKFVKNGFASPRKKLLKVLQSIYREHDWPSYFVQTNISPNVRAAELDFITWQKLYNIFLLTK